jgi:hypothetical protein
VYGLVEEAKETLVLHLIHAEYPNLLELVPQPLVKLDAGHLRQKVVDLFKNYLFQDDLAAEYLLLLHFSKMYNILN